MIYRSTLDTLTEDELSILFFIADRFLNPLDININFIKMLRLNVVIPMLDVLKPQAIEQNRYIFDSLKNKLHNQ